MTDQKHPSESARRRLTISEEGAEHYLPAEQHVAGADGAPAAERAQQMKNYIAWHKANCRCKVAETARQEPGEDR